MSFVEEGGHYVRSGSIYVMRAIEVGWDETPEVFLVLLSIELRMQIEHSLCIGISLVRRMGWPLVNVRLPQFFTLS
jgi:hypothetical protein